MEYIKVQWKHDFDDEPVTLFCELGPDRYETRKVDVFRDGSMGYASEDLAHRTWLGTCLVPSLQEIADDDNEEFEPVEITLYEFVTIWEQALKARSDSSS